MQRVTLFTLAACFAATTASAQVSVGGEPYGLRTGMDRSVIPTVHAAPFDAAAAAAEDARTDGRHITYPYGRALPIGVGLEDSGLWTDLANGDRLWRLRVTSEGAVANELFFEQMMLPTGAELYIYDNDGGQVLGGFTSYNNRPSGIFSTGQIKGSTCIVEYHEPVQVAGQGHLRISAIGHAYRTSDDVTADACEVDVNCSEGADVQAQRDGTVRIAVKAGAQLGYCSGSLVNNLTLDCKPYFLTAKHCGINEGTGVESSTADFEAWKFYFKYQRTGCGTGSAFTNKLLTGCVKRGDSHDNGGDSGSDFLLLEADDATIPDSYTPYWCGWDATGAVSSGAKGIHHPAGSEKKISTVSGSTVSSTWGGVGGTHWRVVWAATTNGHGVTEGGSSGSPLFNSDKRIVGTLTGGGSCCTSGGCGNGTSPSAQDFYGKLSYHWQSNAGATADKLKHWLDPNSTGILTMDGSYGPCGSLGVQQEQAGEVPGVYPNPSSGTVTIVYPQGLQQVDGVEVIDPTGRIVHSFVPLGTGQTELDVSGWSSGTYVVRIISNGVRYSGTRLSVIDP